MLEEMEMDTPNWHSLLNRKSEVPKRKKEECTELATRCISILNTHTPALFFLILNACKVC